MLGSIHGYNLDKKSNGRRKHNLCTYTLSYSVVTCDITRIVTPCESVSDCPLEDLHALKQSNRAVQQCWLASQVQKHVWQTLIGFQRAASAARRSWTCTVTPWRPSALWMPAPCQGERECLLQALWLEGVEGGACWSGWMLCRCLLVPAAHSARSRPGRCWTVLQRPWSSRLLAMQTAPASVTPRGSWHSCMSAEARSPPRTTRSWPPPAWLTVHQATAAAGPPRGGETWVGKCGLANTQSASPTPCST